MHMPVGPRLAHVLVLACCALLVACGGGGGGDDGGDDGGGTALAIAPASLPNGTTGALYGANLFATGGSGAGFSWSLTAGALPPGVSGLPANGVAVLLSGLLGAPGTYDFTVRVRDSGGNQATRAYSVTIDPTGGGGANFATNLVGAPSARYGHSAVWTGTEMIVWGGLQMTGVLNDGAAYDPAQDTWRTISSVGAPAARFGPTAVWTGTEMIVWGGWDTQGPLATGGAYDPVQDTWRTVSPSGAPQARANHTAVWTGSAMVVWGGQGVFPPPAPNSVDLVFGDGGAYDPVTNQWTALTGGTAARVHTAVWTGSRMITWGGRDSFALTLSTQNVGSVYTPAGGTWSATATAAAPTARMDHTAVWAGAAGMVVWGGQTDFQTVNDTGGRYQPGTNTWSPTSTTGAPSQRTRHTAVWTGTEMVIWGGSGPGAYLGDGAAYDPVGDTWRPLTAGFLPSARSDHTAVWTGTAMIVWGGITSPVDTSLNSGAVIQP
jgi:hypothetical protein